MTDTYDTAIKVDVYADEFKTILKAINRAIADKENFTSKEIEDLIVFKDDFATLTLEYGV